MEEWRSWHGWVSHVIAKADDGRSKRASFLLTHRDRPLSQLCGPSACGRGRTEYYKCPSLLSFHFWYATSSIVWAVCASHTRDSFRAKADTERQPLIWNLDRWVLKDAGMASSYASRAIATSAAKQSIAVSLYVCICRAVLACASWPHGDMRSKTG
ncbi:hypothetical protein L7F22_031732 [Adiantum nelumboides]|nr:hypothetical protein [Adiantum nelumboides]